MTQKKHKKKGCFGQQFLSPERFMKEKARKMPLGKCYINDGWEKSGMASVIVTRLRPSGNIVFANVLLDLYCIGVKNVSWDCNMDPVSLEEFLEQQQSRIGVREIDYVEAHNLILGAIEFAEEGGINPHRDWQAAQYILEEDREDFPIIEYDYGKDGKHFLIINEDGAERRHLATLRTVLGDGNFDYVFVDDDYFDDSEQ